MAKRVKKNREKKAPSFMNTYADMVTLLLCFFVLLFSISNVDAAKYQELNASLKGFKLLMDGGGESIIKLDEEGDGKEKKVKVDNRTEEEIEKAKKLEEEIQIMKNDFETYMASDIEKGTVQIRGSKTDLRITFKDGVMFDSGSTDIKDGALTYLDQITEQLGKYQNMSVRIEGHTDNVPINSATYPNNLFLSSGRASRVGTYLMDIKQVDPMKVSAQGFGEYRPIETNDTDSGRASNRRVEVTILNKDS